MQPAALLTAAVDRSACLLEAFCVRVSSVLRQACRTGAACL
jgi:hypothetical protein